MKSAHPLHDEHAQHKAKADAETVNHTGSRLYNLDTDIGETTDVAIEHPEIVKRLGVYIEKMDSDLGVYKNGPGVRLPGRVESPKPLLERIGTEYD